MPPKFKDWCCRPYLTVRIIPVIRLELEKRQELAVPGTLNASLEDDIKMLSNELQALLATQNEILAVISSHLEPLLLCLEIRVFHQYCSLQYWFEKKFKISILLQTALSYISNGDQVIFIRLHQFKAVPFPVEGMICRSTALLDCIKMVLVSTKKFDDDNRRNFDEDRRKDFDDERRKDFDDERRKDFDDERRKDFDDERRKDFDYERRKNFGDERRKDFGDERRKDFGDERRKDFDDERRKDFGDERRKDFGDERRKDFDDERRKDFDDERRKDFGDERRKDFDDERRKDFDDERRRDFGDDRRRDFDGERSFGDGRRKKDVGMNINENHRKRDFRNILIEKALENENFSRDLILVKQALRLYNSDMDDSIFRKLFVLMQNTLSFYVASKISSEMWNSLELECPASDLVAYPPLDHYILENLRDFVTVLTTSADTLTSESPLWNEMKVLQNIQAKYKRILRCDHFLIFLQRVGHCLRKMVLLNLSKSYLDLAERFLVGFQDLSGTPQLPSRQQVEYVLIRTLSASKLVCEAINYSQESFCYIIQKLKVGHLILDLIMATSIIARLNILLRATLEQLSSMYKQVLFWRYKVKKGGFQWAEKFDFPQDIEEWVKSSEPAYLKPLDMSKEDMDRIKSVLKQSNVITNKTKESDNESVVLVSDEDSPTNEITVIETDFGGASKLASGDWQ